MRSIVLTGAHIRLYINNRVYKEVQQITYNVDYGEFPIFGIDSATPQEIAPSKLTVKGSVQGIRIKYSGGLQAYNARPTNVDILSAPYISIRIQDRQSGEDILLLQSAKVTSQQMSIGAKGTVKLSFSFEGLFPFEALDR
jgi:hypothetical protein